MVKLRSEATIAQYAVDSLVGWPDPGFQPASFLLWQHHQPLQLHSVPVGSYSRLLDDC